MYFVYFVRALCPAYLLLLNLTSLLLFSEKYRLCDSTLCFRCPVVVSFLLGPYFALGTFLLLCMLLLHTSYSSTTDVCYNAN